MGNTVADEAYIFYIALAGGVLTGVIFDIFRAFRRQCRGSDGFVAVQDILFWLITAAVIFGLLMRYNYGELRFYILMGIVIGGLLYHAAVSRYVVAGISKIFYMIAVIIRFFAKIISVPLRIIGVPVKFCVISLAKTNKKLKRILCRVKKNIKKTKKQLKMF